MISKVISGGQTGADRAALDWAIRNGVPHGGFCPKDRKALDGPIPEIYNLQELDSPSYLMRTEGNVLAGDGTLLITLKEKLSGGSARTARYCSQHRKPLLHIWSGIEDPGRWVRAFVQEHQIRILNVAGPRATSTPDIEMLVTRVLDETFGKGSQRAGGSGSCRSTVDPSSSNPLKTLFLLTAELEMMGEKLIKQAETFARPSSSQIGSARYTELLHRVEESKRSMLQAMSSLVGECFRDSRQ